MKVDYPRDGKQQQDTVIPPPPPNHQKHNSNNGKRLAIAGILILCILVSGYFMFTPKTSSATGQNKPTEVLTAKTDSMQQSPPVKETVLPQKARVKEQPVAAKIEKFNPAKYLVKTVKFRKNFVGQTVIEGSIKNVSTASTYKDIVLNVEYLSKTGSIISTQKLVVYEIAKPNKRIPFKFKLRSPNGTANLSTSVVDAILTN